MAGKNEEGQPPFIRATKATKFLRAKSVHRRLKHAQKKEGKKTNVPYKRAPITTLRPGELNQGRQSKAGNGKKETIAPHRTSKRVRPEREGREKKKNKPLRLNAKGRTVMDCKWMGGGADLNICVSALWEKREHLRSKSTVTRDGTFRCISMTG